jgi:hypothetical protein
LRYATPATPPEVLPKIRGLLHARRSRAELRLTLTGSDASAVRDLGELRPTSIEEVPVSFSDAITGYLGERGERQFFLEDVGEQETVGGAS